MAAESLPIAFYLCKVDGIQTPLYSMFVSIALHNEMLCIIAGTGIPRNHKPLFTTYEVELRYIHHLCFVYSGLEAEVEVRKKLPVGEP